MFEQENTKRTESEFKCCLCFLCSLLFRVFGYVT